MPATAKQPASGRVALGRMGTALEPLLARDRFLRDGPAVTLKRPDKIAHGAGILGGATRPDKTGFDAGIVNNRRSVHEGPFFWVGLETLVVSFAATVPRGKNGADQSLHT